MKNAKISIIAAMDEKRGIGKNNDLLFRIPEDLKRFKQLTSGHPIIMGRKTFESIGRVLPNRTNIIITRDPMYQVEGATVVHSLEEAIKVASSMYHVASIKNKKEKKSHNTNYILHNTDEIFIIGGGQIFKEAIDKGLVDKLYLTLVEARLPSLGGEATGGQGDFGADTFFPDYSEFRKVVSKERRESGRYRYTFLELQRE